MRMEMKIEMEMEARTGRKHMWDVLCRRDMVMLNKETDIHELRREKMKMDNHKKEQKTHREEEVIAEEEEGIRESNIHATQTDHYVTDTPRNRANDGHRNHQNH